VIHLDLKLGLDCSRFGLKLSKVWRSCLEIGFGYFPVKDRLRVLREKLLLLTSPRFGRQKSRTKIGTVRTPFAFKWVIWNTLQ